MTGYDRIRAAHVASVGGAFLRVRPFVAGAAALLNSMLLARSDAPVAQRIALGVAMGTLILAFALEALALRKREPDERWLLVSLTGTVLVIAIACVASGGAESPMLPISFAPIAIGLAAFGRTRASAIVVASAAVMLAALVASAMTGLGGPPIPLPARSAMTLVSAAASVALVAIGVSGLAEAHRRAGQALERARAQLVDDSLAHAELVESMGLRIAHEIRTPLTSIKALVTLVAESPAAPRTPQRLEVVSGEIDRMEALVSDYLALGRPLDALTPTETSLEALVVELGEVLEGRARARGVTIAVDAARVAIACDPRRVREALLNLAANALDAMNKGGTLTLAVRESEAGAEIEVRDTGPGVDAEALASIGAPFTSGKPQGAGLGALLARKVATQHGGTLRYESERGTGTRAILALPRAPLR